MLVPIDSSHKSNKHVRLVFAVYLLLGDLFIVVILDSTDMGVGTFSYVNVGPAKFDLSMLNVSGV